MSDHFHVHGAHEHEVEHQAKHGASLAQYVAIFTAILSSFAAVVSYYGAAKQNEALLLKNEAVIKQAQASDQWAYYQAKNVKAHLMELAIQIIPAQRTQVYQQQLQRYNDEKQQIQKEAEALENASLQADEDSAVTMANHHQAAQAMMFLQIAIALASITALTKQKWLFYLAGIAAIGGVIFSLLAWLT